RPGLAPGPGLRLPAGEPRAGHQARDAVAAHVPAGERGSGPGVPGGAVEDAPLGTVGLPGGDRRPERGALPHRALEPGGVALPGAGRRRGRLELGPPALSDGYPGSTTTAEP